MNKKISQINKKCGYCGWILPSNAEPIQHSCLSDFDNDINVLLIEKNNIVTIGNRTDSEMEINEPQSMMEATADEILIACVAQKPALYDHRLPLSERTMIKKNALWNEVCNIMGETMDVDSLKKRWKYLKDCYMKDKKKRNKYVASGSASTSKRKSTFRFSEAMSFLSDCTEPKPTSSTLLTNEGEPSPTSVEPVVSPCVSTHTELISPTSIDRPASTCSNISNINSSKRKKSHSTNTDHLEDTFITALMSVPTTGKLDSVDHFVLRLAEGLRQLPYRERAKLEIEFLSRIMEVQEKFGNVSTRIMLEINSIKKLNFSDIYFCILYVWCAFKFLQFIFFIH